MTTRARRSSGKPPAEPPPPSPGTYDRAQGDRGRRGRADERRLFLAQRAGRVDPEELAIALKRRREAAAPAGRARAAPPPGAPPAVADVDLWVPIGPTTVLAGQAGGRPRVTGRVNEVAVSKDGKRAYAASANGGVWYSSDSGDTWAPVGGWATAAPPAGVVGPANIMVCGCMLVAFDPGDDPNKDEILVGTGELLPQGLTGQSGTPGDHVGSIGVLRAVGPSDDPEFNQIWQVEGTNLAGRGIFRLAVDPTTATTFVAATSAGLVTRTGGPAATWTPVPAAPFNTAAGAKFICTDAAWSAAKAPTPARLWVAVRDDVGAASGLFVSVNGTAGPFTPVALAGLQPQARISLAVAPSDPTVVYALSEGNLVWRIDGTTPTTVTRIPPNLLGGQDDYNQAIAVHPTRPERIVLGGATEKADGQYSASLYVASVTGPTAGSYRFGFPSPAPADPTTADAFVGNGVHADVHVARFVTVGATTELWIGCDGGVFRSQRANDDNRLIRNSFLPRNTGMASLEPGYLTTHPQVDGYILAGTQDNGTIERAGDTVWRGKYLGDGGGVAINPSAPHRIMCQSNRGRWLPDFTPGTTFLYPVLRTTGSKTGATAPELLENTNAGFYSGVDTMASGLATASLAFGTYRVWYSPDWGQTWVTLPSYSDPMRVTAPPPVAQNTITDAILMAGAVPDYKNGNVIALRWAAATRLLVLARRIVLQFDITPDAGVASGFRVSRKVLSRQEPGSSEDPQAAAAVASPGQVLPAVGEWSDLAVHDAGAGSFYVAATGDPATPAMDTLWWFDGNDRWHATALRAAAPVPAYAVAVHPTDATVVFVGTAVGVWKGKKTSSDHWDWTPLSNGLPEAVVQDLSTVNAGGVKLLRAAIQARGVWEVDLNGPGTARTYVRVHPWDTRRSVTTGLTDPTKAVPNTALSWHASPDVRVRPRRASKPPNPVGLPWNGASGDKYGLWVFQTALHGRTVAGSQDQLIKPDGQWTPMFDTRLRAANANSNRITLAVWKSIVGSGSSFPNAYADPWAGATPTEADLAELIVDLPAAGASPASMGIRPVAAKVDVLVHHRHLRPEPAANVKVTLLRREVTGTAAAAWAALAGTWAAPVQTFLTTGGAAPALPAGWIFADAANPVRSPAGDVDARLPRAVTFDTDFTGLAAGKRFLLVAVVHSVIDPVALPGSALQALVLGTRFAAVRSVEIV